MDWYKKTHLKHEKSWNEVKQDFLEKFNTPNTPTKSVRKMRDLVQGEEEFVNTYDKMFKDVCHKLEEPPKKRQKIEWFISKLKKVMKEALHGRYSILIQTWSQWHNT